MVLFDDLRQVFQLSAVDAFVLPGQFIAGGYRCGRGVMFKKFFLHLVRYACTEVDAHRALAGGQFVQLFFFGHRRTAFTTGENDGLYLFRDGEL